MAQADPFIDEFQIMLRRILMEEKRNSVAQLSTALALQQRTFYARLENGSSYSPSELAIILHEIPDERLARWLIGDGLVLVERPSATSLTSNGLRRHALLGALTTAEAVVQLLAESRPLYPAGTLHHVAKAVGKSQGHFLWIESYAIGQGRGKARRRRRGFLPLVNRLIVMRHDLRIEELGAVLDLTYDQVQARLSGRVQFDERDVRRLLSAFPEPRIANYFLDDTPYVAMRRNAITATGLLVSPLQASIGALRSIHQLLGMLPSGSGLLQASKADRKDWQEVLSRILHSLDEVRSGIGALRASGTMASGKGGARIRGEEARNDRAANSRRPSERAAPQARLSGKFSDFLRRLLNPGKQQNFVEIAEALGVAPRRLRDLLMSDTRISPKEISGLINCTKNTRIAKWLFSDSILVVLDHSANGPERMDGDPLGCLMGAIIACLNRLLAICDTPGSREGEATALRNIREQAPTVIGALLSAKAQTELLRNSSPDRDFVLMFKKVLFLEKRLPTAAVAASLGLTENDLRLRLETGRFKPAEYRALFRGYPEPRLADALLAGTPYLASLPRQAERADGLLTHILGALRTIVELALSTPSLDEVQKERAEDLPHDIRDGIRQFAMIEWDLVESRIHGRDTSSGQQRKGRIFAQISPVQEAISIVVRPELGTGT